MTPLKPPHLSNQADLAEQVRMVIAVHVEREGMCEGCLSIWARSAVSLPVDAVGARLARRSGKRHQPAAVNGTGSWTPGG